MKKKCIHKSIVNHHPIQNIEKLFFRVEKKAKKKKNLKHENRFEFNSLHRTNRRWWCSKMLKITTMNIEHTNTCKLNFDRQTSLRKLQMVFCVCRWANACSFFFFFLCQSGPLLALSFRDILVCHVQYYKHHVFAFVPTVYWCCCCWCWFFFLFFYSELVVHIFIEQPVQMYRCNFRINAVHFHLTEKKKKPTTLIS